MRHTKYGISLIQHTNDIYPTNYVSKNGILGDVYIRYIYNSKPDSIDAAHYGHTKFMRNGKELDQSNVINQDPKPLNLSQTFELIDDELIWKIKLENIENTPVRIEDFSIPIDYKRPYGENPTDIFERSVIKHSFISGNNSYLYFERPTGLDPYLVMVPLEGTQTEYWN